jgi:hypothetical protein
LQRDVHENWRKRIFDDVSSCVGGESVMVIWKRLHEAKQHKSKSWLASQQQMLEHRDSSRCREGLSAATRHYRSANNRAMR